MAMAGQVWPCCRTKPCHARGRFCGPAAEPAAEPAGSRSIRLLYRFQGRVERFVQLRIGEKTRCAELGLLVTFDIRLERLEEEKEKENKETNPAAGETNWGNDPLVAAVIAEIAASLATAAPSRGERPKTRARFL